MTIIFSSAGPSAQNLKYLRVYAVAQGSIISKLEHGSDLTVSKGTESVDEIDSQ